MQFQAVWLGSDMHWSSRSESLEQWSHGKYIAESGADVVVSFDRRMCNQE